MMVYVCLGQQRALARGRTWPHSDFPGGGWRWSVPARWRWPRPRRLWCWPDLSPRHMPSPTSAAASTGTSCRRGLPSPPIALAPHPGRSPRAHQASKRSPIAAASRDVCRTPCTAPATSRYPGPTPPFSRASSPAAHGSGRTRWHTVAVEGLVLADARTTGGCCVTPACYSGWLSAALIVRGGGVAEGRSGAVSGRGNSGRSPRGGLNGAQVPGGWASRSATA